MATVGTIAINLITRDVSAMRGLRDLHSGVARVGVATQATRQQMVPALSHIEKAIESATAESRKWKNAAAEAAHAPAAHFRKLQGALDGANWNRFVAEMTIAAKQEQALAGTTLALSNQFQQMESSAVRASSSALRVRNSLQNLGGGGRSRAQHGLMEFGRGFEDFAISASTGGIAAGLRGAANNVNAFLAAFGPWGAAASIVVTLGTVLVGMWERSSKSAQDATKDASGFRRELERLLQLTKDRQEQKYLMERRPEAAELSNEVKERQNELRSIDQQMKVIDERRKREMATRLGQDPANKRQSEYAPIRWFDSIVGYNLYTDQSESIARDSVLNEQAVELMRRRQEITRQIAEMDKSRSEQTLQNQKAALALKRQEIELGMKVRSDETPEALKERREAIDGRKKELQEALRGRLHGDARSALSLLESAGQRLAPREFGELQKMMQMAEQREKIQQLSIPEAARAQLSQLVTAAGLQELRPEDNQPPKLMAMLQQGSAEAFNQAVRSSQKPPESKLDAQQLSALKELLTTLKGVEKNTAPQTSDTFSIP